MRRRTRPLVQHHRQVGGGDERRDVRRRRRVGDLGEPRTAAPAWTPRAPWSATGRATCRPARPSTPRPSGAAAQGTIRATPISVSTSTASSPRSPLGIACTTVTDGRRRRERPRPSRHGHRERSLARGGDRPRDRPAPAVGQHDGLADPQTAYGDGVVRLVARDLDHRAHRRVVERRHPVDRQRHQAAQCPLNASRSRPNIAAALLAHLSGRLLLVPDRGQLAEQLLLARVEPGRRLDETVTIRSPRPERRPGTPRPCIICDEPDWRARLDVELERRLDARRSVAGLRRRPGRPRASAGSAWCRARPRSSAPPPSCAGRCPGGRTSGARATWISTYRSPAGPPPGPTSPCSASWTRVPVSTPAGILTVSVRRDRTRPSPEHSRHGSGMIEPKPRQAAHGRRVRISPRNDRCTWATSPAPWQVSHGTGLRPGRRCPRRGRSCRPRRCRP